MGQNTDTIINLTLVEKLGDVFDIHRRPIHRDPISSIFRNKCYYIYDHNKTLLGTLQVAGSTLVLKKGLSSWATTQPALARIKVSLCDEDCFKKIREYFNDRR